MKPPAALALGAALFLAASVLCGAPGIGAAAEKALLKLQEASAAMLRGRYEKAVALYDEVLQDPTLPKHRQAGVYNDRGVAKWRQQSLEDALADFAKAIEVSPDYAPVYNNRGAVLMELDRVEEAYQDFDKAIALSPGFAAAYNNRGNANHELKRFDAAAADFRKAVELMPSNSVPFNGRGKTLAALGRSYSALRYLNRALTLNGQYTAAYENRARVYAHLERYDDALADLDKVLEMAPDNVELLILRGVANAKLRRTQAALRDLGRALEIEPDNAEALVRRAAVNLERKRADAALEDLNQAIGIDAEMADAWYHRALAQKQKGDLEASKADVEKALTLDPSFAEAHLLKASLSETEGDTEAAIAGYRKALELDPFSQEARKAFEKASGEKADSVVKPLAEPVSGWEVYSPAEGRFVAVNPQYPKISVLLEMHGPGTAEILEWTPLKDWLRNIGLLRYKAGDTEKGAYEYVAILDLGAAKVVAIEPYLWGEQKARWEWTENTVTVTDPEGLASHYELRRPKPVEQPRVASDDPWNIFGAPRGGGGRRYREPAYRGPSLFDWLFR